MRSTFFGLNIARSGLFASQRSLDIVGHNISNVETPGYTRQRLNQTAYKPMDLTGGKGQIGTGVDMTQIVQIRDEFLDQKYRSENTSFGEWDQRFEGLSQVEAIINEPSKTGIRSVMDTFFASFQELSTDPGNKTVRATVRQNGIALAGTITHMYNQMENMVKSTNFEVEATVNDVNSMATQLAKLNKAIFEAEVDGSKANDLRDERNLILDDLSKTMKIQVVENLQEGGSSKLSVLVNGIPLVRHDEARAIKMEIDQPTPLYKKTSATTPPTNELKDIKITNLKWSTGEPIDMNNLGGTLGGLVQMRDSYDDDKKGVPYYIQELNKFAREFSKAFNDVHKEGYGIGQTTKSPTFFTANGDSNSTDTISAKNIKISSLIDGDINLIAAAGNSGGATDDNLNAKKLLEMRNVSIAGLGTKPDDFIKSIVSNLGVDASEAKRMAKNTEAMVTEVQNQRLSVSGVNLDEEMSNMIKFQHAYNASARMITTMDEMIDVIVNRMGRVGL